MFKKCVLLIALINFQLIIMAQPNIPYTQTGIGSRSIAGSPVYSGIGNHFVTYNLPSVLNTENAASYAFLRYQFPIFSVGVSNRFSTNYQDGIFEKNNLSTFSEMAFGLSFAKRFGFAFGLKPMYNKSYAFIQKDILLSDSIRYSYHGNGNINKAFLGFSVKILNYDSLKWSIGSNFGAVFGTVSDNRKSSIITLNSNAGGGDIKTQHIKSFQYDLGSILQFYLKNGNKFVLGATFEPLQNINSIYNHQLYYSTTNVNNPNSWVILKEISNEKGSIVFVPSYNLGVSYAKNFNNRKNNGSIRNSQIQVFASYSDTKWSEYKERYKDSINSINLKNSNGLQLGLQYIPETQYIGNAMPKLLNRTSYRIGYYNNYLPYTFKNNQLKENAITFGFGFPILVDRRLDSSIQLGFAYGKKGINDNQAFNENFFVFNFGILVAPSINDRWFIKRKLD